MDMTPRSFSHGTVAVGTAPTTVAGGKEAARKRNAIPPDLLAKRPKGGGSCVGAAVAMAAPSSWFCHRCTFENLKGLSLACEVCGTERCEVPVSSQPGGAAWVCRACTLVNQVSATICSACDAVRGCDTV